jgi:hypothetical protein
MDLNSAVLVKQIVGSVEIQDDRKSEQLNMKNKNYKKVLYVIKICIPQLKLHLQ